jgi:hypothetical protein
LPGRCRSLKLRSSADIRRRRANFDSEFSVNTDPATLATLSTLVVATLTIAIAIAVAIAMRNGNLPDAESPVGQRECDGASLSFLKEYFLKRLKRENM